LYQNSNVNIGTYIKGRQEGFINLYKEVKQRIEARRFQNANRYNLRRRPVSFVPGDKVWRKNKVLSNAANYYAAKLAPEYVGPFVIKRKTGSWSYELQDDFGNHKGVWHVQDLKPFCDPSIMTALDEPPSSNNALWL